MNIYEKLLLENKAWAREKTENNPGYFKMLAKNQTPEFLWIGCSDSRIPANEVTGTMPGELFVHRNIANMVVKNDINLLSVVEYAVAHLKVKHIIICGHYGCGGVNAALSDQSYGMLDQWLRHIKDVKTVHQDELDQIPDKEKKAQRLVELNTEQQVRNLAETDIMQHAWRQGPAPHIHGWVYSLQNGLIKPVFDQGPGGGK